VLDTLGFITEQPLSSAHPARADLNLTPQEQGHGETEGVERCLPGLIPLEIQAVGGFKGTQRLIDVTEPPCGVPEGREIVGLELHLPPDGLESIPGSGPVAALERPPGFLEKLGRIIPECLHANDYGRRPEESKGGSRFAEVCGLCPQW
jgi:hypothetical protein